MSKKSHCDICDACPAESVQLRIGICKDPIDGNTKYDYVWMDMCLPHMAKFLSSLAGQLDSGGMYKVENLISYFKKLET